MLDEPKTYIYLWSKYRPVILQLMSAALEEPQQYKLFAHEFKALSSKEKMKYTFSLSAYKGKAQNDIRTSQVAQELLKVLQQSRRASELMNEAMYELSMDKNFVLHINRVEQVVPESAEVAIN